MSQCQCWNRVFGLGSRLNDFGLVGSARVSVIDPVSDPVFVVFALLLLLGERIRHLGVCEIAVVLN